MLISAMVWVSAVTLLLGAAAWAAEHALGHTAAPRRLLWALVVLATPSMVGLALARGTTTPVPPPAVSGAAAVTPAALPAEVQQEAAPRFRVPASLDPWAAGGWALLSLVLSGILAQGASRLRSERNRWTQGSLEGRQVLLSEARGPAVVGVLHPRVVVPRWVLDMAPPQRELMLRHEEEHRRAGDPRLFAAALGVLVLLPWNLPLWWVVGRLRLALEIDCDRRVLGRAAGVRAYASLLIDIGARGGASHLAALAFAPTRSVLERRIRAMTDSKRPARLRTLTLGAVATLLVVAACRVDRPAITTPESGDNLMQPSASVEGGNSPFKVRLRLTGNVLMAQVTDPATGEGPPGLTVYLPEAGVGSLVTPRGQAMLAGIPRGKWTLMARQGRDGGAYVLGQVVVTSDGPMPARRSGSSLAPPAEGSGAVTGTVFVGDERVQAAQVTVEGTGLGALTNTSGKFLLLRVPVGKQTLVIRKDGFADQRVEVDVKEGTGPVTPVEVRLKKG